jgi:ABC-type methionine transport system ATPase subunit
MLKYNAYETPLSQEKHTDKTYLRNIHREFFNKWYGIVQDCEYSEIFDGNIDEPIIANIVQDCSILVSIVHANSQVIDNKIYGQIVFKLPYYEKEINKLKQYLSLKNIKFEEVGTHEL